ncbi:hypothetical protein F8M41_025389 [Gigaspora margarita]|uniref:Uncharacterized protein n=1 Tax=Gigaspora margarita TaxID=4874 RepID=A0A8H4AB83_GIGMA|nr:hypothetical protein F8M41_025389 [Gigaspora margarita]
MGDMPELMENILNNLKNEPNSLYSCVLDLNLSDLEFNTREWTNLNLVEPNIIKNIFRCIIVPEFNIENYAIFLKVLAKNITISSLNLVIYSDYGQRLFHSLFLAIIRIIKSQEQLKLFSLDGGDHRTEFYAIISAFECQKKTLYKKL